MTAGASIMAQSLTHLSPLRSRVILVGKTVGKMQHVLIIGDAASLSA